MNRPVKMLGFGLAMLFPFAAYASAGALETLNSRGAGSGSAVPAPAVSAVSAVPGKTAAFARCEISETAVSDPRHFAVKGEAPGFLLDSLAPRRAMVTFVRLADGFEDHVLLRIDMTGAKLSGAAAVWAAGGAPRAMTEAGAGALRFDIHGVSGKVTCRPAELPYAFVPPAREWDADFQHAEYSSMAFQAGEAGTGKNYIGGACLAGDVQAAYRELGANQNFPQRSTLHLNNGRIAYFVDAFLGCTSTETDYNSDPVCVGPIYQTNGNEIIIEPCN